MRHELSLTGKCKLYTCRVSPPVRSDTGMMD